MLYEVITRHLTIENNFKKMKQILLTIITLSTLSFSQLKADEGMWLLPLINKLNIDQMQKMGLQLSSEDIYNRNNFV